jgi:hypothetical protein
MAQNKFEEMLERLINEDKEGAEELFHEIVVEKSRDIYESLLESDLDLEEESDEEVDESEDEDLDEATDEEVDESDDEEVDEAFDLDEFEVEADPMDMGGDAADDMMGDIEDEMGDDEDEGEEGEEGDMEDRVEDLEDALDDLKAEFEKMMAGDDGDEEDSDDMDDMDDGEEEADKESLYFGEAEDEDDEDEEVEEAEEATEKSATEQMREYVEKVAGGHGAESKGKGETADNKKSPVAGKNDMGGTTSNIVAGGEADTKGTAGGLANPSEKEENAGNVNVPGGKASKSMKAMPKGHGAEKKGAGEAGADAKPVIGG